MFYCHKCGAKVGKGEACTCDADIGKATIEARTMLVFVAEGYDRLFMTLIGALEQAQSGKGKERHAKDNAFEDQPIRKIADLLGTEGMGYQTGQAIKKTVEAHGMVKRGQHEAATREILGAINYLAAAVIRINDLAQEAQG